MKSWLAALCVLPLSFSTLAAERIVSIGGDVTQIIYALNGQKDLVARDTTSLHPEEVKKLPDVGYMRMLNPEGILALKPTLVLTTELAKPALALEQVAKNGVKVVDVTGKTDVSAINQKIETVAVALHREQEGKALQAKISTELASIPKTQLPVKVLFILAHQGMGTMAAGSGTSADSAIQAAGLQNAMASVNRYQALSQEGVVASGPQLIVITTDGLKTVGGEANLWKLPGLALTPAAKNKQLLVVDDMALLGFGIDTPAAILKLRQTAETIK